MWLPTYNLKLIIIFYWGKIYERWNLPFKQFLNVQLGSIKYIQFIVWPSLPYISRTFSLSQIEVLCPLN